MREDQMVTCGGGFSPYTVEGLTQSEPSHATSQVCIHSPVSLGFFHFLSTVNNAPVSMSVYSLFSLLHIYPEVRSLGHVLILILIFEELPHCFPERLHHFVQHALGSSFPVSDTTGYPQFLFVLIVTLPSSDYQAVPHCTFHCISLMMNNVEQFSCVYLAICIFFGEMS